jgi:mono/diheme cytochrome c family protein
MKSIIVLALACYLLAGAGLTAARGQDDLFRQGKGVFEENCAQCHRANGEGLPDKFPALNKNSFVLGDPKPVINTVLNGRKGEMGQMPAWKDKLDDGQIAAAATYIRGAWTNRAPGVTPEMVKGLRGK